LIHEGKQPFPSAAIFQISNTFNHHINAWRDLALPTVWTPPVAGWIKGNFDVAVRGSFAVAAAVLSDTVVPLLQLLLKNLSPLMFCKVKLM
jgi:hypothetical protein